MLRKDVQNMLQNDWVPKVPNKKQLEAQFEKGVRLVTYDDPVFQTGKSLKSKVLEKVLKLGSNRKRHR